MSNLPKLVAIAFIASQLVASGRAVLQGLIGLPVYAAWK